MRVFSILLFLTFTLNLSFAQKVNEAILQLAGDATMKHGSMSFSLIDRNNGQIVATYQPNVSLIPASSLKILTCAYGLEVLGSDFKFKTELYYSGTVDKAGTLDGDIIIKGYGDPTLGSEMTDSATSLKVILSQFVNAVKKKGIKRVNGKVYADATFLSSEGVFDNWAYYDLGNYYAAGVYGLNINDNLYRLNFKQSKKGSQPGTGSVIPGIPGLVFKNNLISDGTSDNAYIYGAPGQYHLAVRGSIPPGNGIFTIKGSMPEPPLQAAQILHSALESSGIKVSQKPASSLQDKVPSGKRELLVTHLSQDIETIIRSTLLHSLNLNTDAILRQCGVKLTGKNSIPAALDAYISFAEKLIGEHSGFFIKDGSGLSGANGVPSLGFCKLLFHFYQDSNTRKLLLNSLPIAGVRGTLKNYLTNSPAVGKITAKTGSMDRVRSYSGFITGYTGKEYVFALLINNYDCNSAEIKKKVEDFFNQLYLSL